MNPEPREGDTASIGRYAEVPVERMPAGGRDAHQALLDGPRSRVSGPFRIWLANPLLVHALAGVDAHINSPAFALTPREREICILVTTETYGTEYVWAAHKRLGKASGLAERVIEKIASRDDPGLVDQRERTVHELAVTLQRGAGNLPRPLHEQAIDTLGHSGLSDLIALLGYYASVCFTMNAYAVPADGGPAAD
jgi:4-carboxymuconolactone decarboxylase